MEVVNNIISNCRDKYKDRFKYYLTGSYARNEKNFKDYDIAIYDLENNNKDWELLLKQFFNVKELDGKMIDAQIDQMTNIIIRMNGQTLYENRSKKIYLH